MTPPNINRCHLQLRAHQQAVARRIQEDAAPPLNGGGNAGGWGVPMNE